MFELAILSCNRARPATRSWAGCVLCLNKIFVWSIFWVQGLVLHLKEQRQTYPVHHDRKQETVGRRWPGDQWQPEKRLTLSSCDWLMCSGASVRNQTGCRIRVGSWDTCRCPVELTLLPTQPFDVAAPPGGALLMPPGGALLAPDAHCVTGCLNSDPSCSFKKLMLVSSTSSAFSTTPWRWT